MTLSIYKTIHIDREEKNLIENKYDYFIDKYCGRNYTYIEEAIAAGLRAYNRWMQRNYGYPGFIITGSNGQYTLSLGRWVE